MPGRGDGAEEPSAGPEDPLEFVLARSGAGAATFLSVLAISRATGWLLVVGAAAKCRHLYLPLLRRRSGAIQRAREACFLHFPRASLAVANAAERTAQTAERSRSATVLASALGISPRQLAPAAAEGTVAFRCIWPLWFPLQCWAMVRFWPTPAAPVAAVPPARGVLSPGITVELDDGRTSDL
eukprot:gnl/TRDRNA2_/TRDRNA2_42411_c0_seq1.p2 gnl/TRDRNA2_/TRDRNA2_42411_c0~~gnl/TRDRNA2_/TRDRNA2_42411_c0_seq1.p2  ORF type:complete len:183 (+),score=27.45 gnl/TRDRNA2_/TRDRNA2_42411_c0_seq1:139-687(+)